ncbi:MAG: Nif3-like dinuclear metal center hexameric protein [Proteobacteria bacterium]|nr:Nif3-like dinuclear metal center hexameric protein [Pseudomonadota bacterium]
MLKPITLKEVVRLFEEHIPQTEGWRYFKSETYGGFNITEDISDKPLKRVLYCVTASEELGRYSLEHGYDLLFAHHPFVIPGVPMFIAHTPLDCCEGGLNDILADIVGLKKERHIVDNLGWYGHLDEPDGVVIDEIIARLERHSIPIKGNIILDGNRNVKTGVVCSGLGGLISDEVIDLKPDLYVTGQLSYKIFQMNVIELGHTNSEQIGVYTLRNILSGYDITVDLAPVELDVFGNEILSRN